MHTPQPAAHRGPDGLPLAARLVTGFEHAAAADALAKVLGPVANAVSSGGLGRLLRGEPLGHTAHPMLTDLPIGFWTSAVTLDLCTGKRSRSNVMLLLALGSASVPPTVLTGLAEWRTTNPAESRVGSIHAIANAIGTTCFTAAWCAHRQRRRGVALGLEMLGTAAATFGGLLGGHLASARKVGTRNPAYDDGS